MAISLTPIEPTDNFGTWLQRTNDIITELGSRVMTASPAGNTTVGNAILVGNFSANNVSVNLASGFSTGFSSRFAEIRQAAGNTSAIAVQDPLNVVATGNTSFRLTAGVGPRFRANNTVAEWDFGANNGLANTAFVFNFQGTQMMSLSANGDAVFRGGITANGGFGLNSGVFTAYDGSAGAPSYTFGDDDNTGVYSSANDTVSISTGGTERVRVGTTGILQVFTGAVLVANGSVSNPGLSFVSDPNSGFFGAAADTIALTLGGLEKIRFAGNALNFTTSTGQTQFNFGGYFDINSGHAAGIRVGTANAISSRMTFYSPNTTTALIQAVADENSAGQIRVLNAAGANYPAYSFFGDTNTGIDNPAADTISFAAGGVYRLSANTTQIRANLGLSFGANTANTWNDLSRHIDLWGAQYGLGVTSSSFNLVAPTTAAFRWINSATNTATMELHNNSGNPTLRVPDGLVNLPGISWIGDTNSGFYSVSDGIFAATVNGIERFRFSSSMTANGTISGPLFNATAVSGFQGHASDTAAAPSFTWTDDTDTGMYRVGSNSIGFAIAATNKVTINSAGITLAGSSRFIADSLGSATTPDYCFSGAGNYGMYYSGNYLRFSAGGVNMLSLNEALVYHYVPNRFAVGSAASPGIQWQGDPNSGMLHSTYTHMVLNGGYVARFEAHDDTVLASTTVLTRIKADARYVNESSIRYKDQLGIIPKAELSQRLLTAFDAFDLTSWVWGKEISNTNIKFGTTGIGIIAEEVEKYLPEAVKYQWVDGEDGEATKTKQPNALDPMPIIASLIEKIRQLETRLEAVGG